MTTAQQTRTAGPYISGEIPLPFTVKFSPTDIVFTGFVLAATMENHDGTERTFTGTVTWGDINTGLVNVQFAEADLLLTAGVEHVDRVLMIWAGDGAARPATLRIKVPIDWSVGTPPVI